MKILLTGATGFIGSNIALDLLERGFNVFATHRNSSNFEKCKEFVGRINWINTDSSGWKDQIKTIEPDQLIHVAWGGIKAEQRNDWEKQIQNFWLSKAYFDLVKECGVKKVIAFGSQAEYGIYDSPVKETDVTHPNDAYGAVKILTANYLRSLFEGTETQWYWIRIFSVFGEKENPDWLIPKVISRLLRNECISLTGCEQIYNYLYIQDFLNQLITVVQSTKNKSGIYNLCHSESIRIKDLLIEIAELINVSQELLQFGSIPYRHCQNMLIAGNNSKFTDCFSVNENSLMGISKGLIKTINYHKEKLS